MPTTTSFNDAMNVKVMLSLSLWLLLNSLSHTQVQAVGSEGMKKLLKRRWGLA